MRFIVVVSMCAFTAPAVADVGVGAAAGSEDRTILFPIRLSSVIIEPYLGYREDEAELNSVASSTERLDIGVGVFGLAMRGDNLSIYYGARLADVSEESSTTVDEIEQSRVDIDGYRIAPTVGFQYTISRVTVGAEIGWAYEEFDQTRVFFGSPDELTIVSKGTHANVVFRFFF
jgi:hypothetical protein